MLTSELHYELPPELIAAEPAQRRDASRLLVLDRGSGRVQHEQFARLPDLLPPGALLVFNDTRVLPARIEVRRTTGGQLEGLFLREVEGGVWELMLTGAGRVRPGERVTFEDSAEGLVLIERAEQGVWRARPDPPGAVTDILGRYGSPPVPPYILRRREQEACASSGGSIDRDRYQTVYARTPGAVAAPTAGLHFTPALMNALRDRGFETRFVTLHVGVGTFAPIRAENLADHEMHAEWYECPPDVADAVNAARAAGRPVVAVGTTSVRVLETCAAEDQNRERKRPALASGEVDARPVAYAPDSDVPSACRVPHSTFHTPHLLHAGSGWTRIFLYPPYAFRAVDAMITNFHLPESTLLAMLFAFAGRERILGAYQEAIRERYRFYSYGDAMLIR